MTYTSSYAEVSSVAVKAACEEWLSARNTKIAEHQEKLVQKELNKKRWFGKQLTHEQAEIRAGKGYIWGNYEAANNWWWLDNSRVEALLELAKKSKTVYLSSEDAYIISKYLIVSMETM